MANLFTLIFSATLAFTASTFAASPPKEVTRMQIADRTRASLALNTCDSGGALHKCFKDLEPNGCAALVSDAFSTCLEQVASMFKPTYKEASEANGIVFPLMACTLANFTKAAKQNGKWLTTPECAVNPTPPAR